MHWPEDLIVGGVKKNRTGHIVKANAFQSVIQLMGEQAMFDYWAKDYKVHNIDWSLEKARAVLEAWQRKFAATVSKAVGMNSESLVKRVVKDDLSASHDMIVEESDSIIEGSNQYSYSLFTTTLLKDIMENFSITSHVKMTVGFVIVTAYVCLVSWSTSSASSSVFIGISGVCLISMSIISSFGSCALLRLPINASTTQVTPFLSLGFGVFLMFMVMTAFKDVVSKAQTSTDTNSYCTVESMTGEVLSSVGKQVIVISLCVVSSLISAAILPIPALRSFVLQFALIVSIVTACTLLLIPAVLALDLKRRRSRRRDLLCCFFNSCDDDESNGSESSSDKHSNIIRSPSIISEKNIYSQKSDNMNNGNSSDTESATCLDQDSQVVDPMKNNPYEILSVRYFVHSLFSVPLSRKPIQVIVIFFFTSLALFLMSYIPSVKVGLDLTDIVPRDTIEHKFLDNQQKYFSFYHMFAVTKGNFEYPTNQRLLYDYHNSFTRISKIIKNDDGGLPDFWLSVFRDWLINLQTAFDRDANLGYIDAEGWNKTHASDEGILAYKLLVQTGRNDYPIDKTLVSLLKVDMGTEFKLTNNYYPTAFQSQTRRL
jgi:patched 1 protein